jgi:ATP-dependent DNA ligase
VGFGTREIVTAPRDRSVIEAPKRAHQTLFSETIADTCLEVVAHLTEFFLILGMGFEGIVSKRIGSRYVSGRTWAWLKTKNPDFERR